MWESPWIRVSPRKTQLSIGKSPTLAWTLFDLVLFFYHILLLTNRKVKQSHHFGRKLSVFIFMSRTSVGHMASHQKSSGAQSNH
jgi:hypothetical protein